MVKKLFFIFLTSAILLTGCGKKNQLPALHSIPYPEGYTTTQDMDGADAFGNSLDHADSKYFVINDYYNMKAQGSLHILEHFETYQQSTEYTCGCCTALMVLNHFGIKDYDELGISEIMNTTSTSGTTVEAMRDFFVDMGWNVEYNASAAARFAEPEDFSAFVIEKIDSNTPIMIDWCDWGGHWQTIIGIDTMDTESPYDDVLILADPYDTADHYQDGYYIYPLGRFFYMWFEGPCTENNPPYQQPFVVASPKQ